MPFISDTAMQKVATKLQSFETREEKRKVEVRQMPVCSEVTHPFARKLTTLAERNWLGRSVATRVPNLRN